MRGKPMDGQGKEFSVSEFEVMCAVGTAGANVMFRGSWDRGLTWGDELTESLGAVGEYRQKVKFYGLDHGEIFTPEIACADPVDVVFYSDARIELA
jgi:hypothetical protein